MNATINVTKLADTLLFSAANNQRDYHNAKKNGDKNGASHCYAVNNRMWHMLANGCWNRAAADLLTEYAERLSQVPQQYTPTGKHTKQYQQITNEGIAAIAATFVGCEVYPG